MLIVAMMFLAIYTVFVPVFAGRKHFFVGLSLLLVLGIVAWVLHVPGLS